MTLKMIINFQVNKKMSWKRRKKEEQKEINTLIIFEEKNR